jgi:hypothetical protein
MVIMLHGGIRFGDYHKTAQETGQMKIQEQVDYPGMLKLFIFFYQ